MTLTHVQFARLEAPRDHGGVLVEPAPDRMRAALEGAPALIEGWDVRLADLHLPEVRRAVRRRVAGVDDDRPIVMTGHQPEFIHPGVWAKHVVVSRLAQAAGGVAVNLVVDTDTPKTTALTVPHQTDGRLRREQVGFAAVAAGVPYAAIPALAAGQAARIAGLTRELLGERFDRSLLPVYFAALGRGSEAEDFVDQLIAARGAVEQRFGVRMLERRVSRAWLCPLLLELLRGAPRFVDCYNAALAEYRAEQRIRGRQHPIPDLLRAGDRRELPLWVLRPGRPRERLFVEQGRGALVLHAGDQRLGALPMGALRHWDAARDAMTVLGEVRFAPRALTLMLWARLLLADLFVHGIGGAKYDRITDRLIRLYFGIEPPPMACVSATLRLDLPRSGTSAEALRARQRLLRDLHHNPQRHLDGDAEVARLAGEKGRAVEESARLRSAGPAARARRRELFGRVRALNRRMLDRHPQPVREAEAALRRLEAALGEDVVADSREYFFALFDEASLRRLCDALPAANAFRV